MADLKTNYNDGDIFSAADINNTNREVNAKLPKSGGTMYGGINFGHTSNALSWIYIDGRQWHMRPDADIDLFQIVRVNSDGSVHGYFNIDADGNATFNRPLNVGTGGTGSNSAAGARQNLDIPEWRPGDVFTLPWAVYMSGIVTSGGQDCIITIPLGCPIRASSAAASGSVILRGNQGYLDNMDSGNGVPISGGDFTNSVEIANAKAGLIKFSIHKNSAFTNVANNTPVALGTATTPQFKITFA